MSSFSTPSEAAAAGEAVHHIRRLSPSPSSSQSNDWYPFQSEAEFNLNIAVALIFLLCFIIGVIGINALIKCVYSSHSPDNQSSSSSSSTSEQKLSQMFMGPTQIFNHELMLAGADHPECTICLSEFVEGEGLRVLPKCNHGFHVKCIESWLLNRNSCPTCRTTCLKTATEKKNSQEDQQQQQNDVDVEATANHPPPVTENLQDQQQQQNDIDIEAGNPPVAVQQQQQQQSSE